MAHRILIVEDEPGMIELLTVALEDEGYEVFIASNGVEGLEQIEKKDPDLVISDVMMPDMNGFDFCQQLRNNPRTASIPFIFLTAKKDVSDRVKGLNAGADDYISKPFHIVEVVARIRSLLQRSERVKVAQRTSTAETEKDVAAIKGNLQEVGIGELFQTFVVLTKKTGRLVVTSGQRKGEIYFQDGNVIHAIVDRRKGEEAVYRLLTWKSGQFTFDTGVLPPVATMKKSAEGLLMEGMRRLDEYHRLLDQFPSPDTPLEVTSLTEEGLSIQELNILNLINRYSTLDEVVYHSNYNQLDTLKLILKLYNQKIIRVPEKKKSKKKQEKPDYDQLADDLFG
ncbi:MAG TPA: response regulator [Candidatus Limnocylindrales bacterium]|nr:response regulator [Candidatus Limnocylindrales bacterium]